MVGMTKEQMPEMSTKDIQAGRLPGDRSVRWQPQWDRQLIAASQSLSSHEVRFFGDGQDGSHVRSDTNVATPGRLAESEDFVVEGIAVQCFSTVAADIMLVARGLVTLKISAFEKLELPVFMCGGGGGIWSASDDGSTAIYQLGGPAPGLGYWFPSDPRNRRSPYAVKVKRDEEFEVTLFWSGLITGTISANTYVYVGLYGHFAFDQDS